MTEKKTEDSTMENIEKPRINPRINRRKILKAGAVIAPLAVTLHSGIPLAHANSANCMADMKKHIRVPVYKDKHGNGTYERTGHTKEFDRYEYTNRLNSDGSSETHWDYIMNENADGVSCLQSYIDNGNS